MKLFTKKRKPLLWLVIFIIPLLTLTANLENLIACEQEGEGADNGGSVGFTLNLSYFHREDRGIDSVLPGRGSAELSDFDVCKAGGKVFLEAPGIEVPGIQGLPETKLQFVPTYSSQSTYSEGKMGYGWQHNYNVTIKDLGDTAVLKDADGTLVNFIHGGGGIYLCEPGFNYKLTKIVNFELKKPHGTVYHFNVLNKLSQVVDRVGNTLTLNYDTYGRLESVTDDSNRSLIIGYGEDGLIDTVTDPLGRKVEYTHDEEERLIKAKRTVTKEGVPQTLEVNYLYEDELDIYKVTKVEDARGKSTTFEYNLEYNSVTKIVEPLVEEEPRQTLYDVNKALGETTVTGKNGVDTLYPYEGGKIKRKEDAFGTIEYGYDDNKNLTSYKDRENHTTQWEYISGNPMCYIDALDNTWGFIYDSEFNKLKTMKDPLDNPSDPLDNTITQEINSETGNVESITDACANTTSFTYYTTGKIHTITDARGEGYTSTFEYDDYGGIKKFTDPLENTTDYVCDTVGNLLSITDANSHTTSFTYNELNRLTKTTRPDTGYTKYDYDENSNLTHIIRRKDATNGLTTLLTYDDADRLETVTDPLSHSTTYKYWPTDKLKEVVDANNKSVTYDYDDLKRLKKFTDRMGYFTEYDYYGSNTLKTIKDAEENTTTYYYWANNLLKKAVYPDTSFEEFTYLANNLLETKTDRKDQTITYEYYDNDWLNKKTYPNETTITYGYDNVGNLTSVVDANGTTAFDYDELSRLDTATYPGNKTFSYTYDDVGNRETMTDPDSNVLTYEYDSCNRLTYIKNAASQALVHYTYDLLGRREKAEYLNGTYTEYAYDDADRLLTLVNKKSDATVISSFSYVEYDNVGNCKTLTTSEGTHSYTYDDNYQLKTVTYPDTSSTTYNYDHVGNRDTVVRGETTDNYTTNSLNQYTQINSTTLTYDDNGSLTNDGTFSYGYDYENRLVSASKTGVSASYTYDYAGRRIKKDVNSAITKYFYDGDQCVLETNSSGTTQARYIYGAGIDEPIMMIRGGNTYYYHYDGLGNVVTMTDSSENVVESYTYDVFGEVSIKDGEGDPLSESAIGNPYFFTGRRLDSETELYYYRARYHDPELGRFLQVDPVGYQDGMNLYAYVRNNPVRYVDPLGLGAGALGRGKDDDISNIPEDEIGWIEIYYRGLEGKDGEPDGWRLHPFIKDTWNGEYHELQKVNGKIKILRGDLSEHSTISRGTKNYMKTNPKPDKKIQVSKTKFYKAITDYKAKYENKNYYVTFRNSRGFVNYVKAHSEYKK